MANFIVSYDLNGPYPSHQQMDDHIRQLPCRYGRILETVWYVGFAGTRQGLFDYVRSILSPNDQLLVVDCLDASFVNLLVNQQEFVDAWNANR